MADGPPSEAPTHLLVEPGDRRTLCGLDGRKTYPQMLARFVPAHRAGHAEAGHPFVVCAECEQVDRTDNLRRCL
jgi:hypothetical protein